VPQSFQDHDGSCKINVVAVNKAHSDDVVPAKDSFAPSPGDTWVVLDTAAQGWGLDLLTTLITGKESEAFTFRASWAASVRSLLFSPDVMIGQK
jgi:hypothetical protein